MNSWRFGVRSWLTGLVLICVACLAWGIWFYKFRPTTEQLLRRGIHSVDRQDNATAIVCFDTVLSREPDHAQALMLRGQLAREAGELTLAQNLWKRVPDVPETDGSKARYLEGALLLELGKARDAERALLRAIELDASYLPPREILLRLYVVQQRTDDIRRQLLGLREHRAWTLEELLLFSMAPREIENAAASQPVLEKMVAADPADVASRLGLAKVHDSQGHDDEAIAVLRAGLRDNPRDPGLIGLLATYLLQRSDLAGAQSILSKAEWDGAQDLMLYRSLGTYAADIRAYDRAVEILEYVTKLAPFDLPSNYQLGLALEAVGRTKDGAKFLERAKQLDLLANQLVVVAIKRTQLHAEPGRYALDVANSLADLARPIESLLWVQAVLEWEPQNRQALALRHTLQRRLPPSVNLTAALTAEIALNGPAIQHAPFRTPADLVSLPVPNGRAVTAISNSRIQFREAHESVGIDFRYFAGETGNKYLIESMGGGVAVIDYDGDGWPDLYFTQGARIPLDPTDDTYRDRLFRNLGDGRFEDVTLAAGLGDSRYSQGCVAGDIDNDGDTDLIVANWGENALYVNNGDGTFVEAARQWGLAGSRWHASLALADFDRDGNLDLYAATYLLEPLRTCRTSDGRVAACNPRNYEAEQDVLYRNRGDGTFEDVSSTAGILAPDGKGLGLMVSDLNGDGWPDLYVANDGTPNFLFRNLGEDYPDGLHFVEEGLTSGSAVGHDGLAQGSMGIACSDFNGDGRPDMYVTNFYMECSAFYWNQGDMSFTDAIRSVGLYAATRPMLGFGTQAADFDLDGWPDLFVTNGHIDDFRFRGEPWKMPPQVFRNQRDGTFADVSQNCGDFFRGHYLGRGVARVDWDRDGLPDIVVSHLDGPAALLRNETQSAGNSLIIELHGVESNRDAIGAVLKIKIGTETRIQEICGGDGYYASNERRQVIGLGKATVIDELEIRWPSGAVQSLVNVAAGQEIYAIEGRSTNLRSNRAHSRRG
jgi:tetratricopeptide (TPR) repeat protein